MNVLKQNRIISFVIVTLIYILAALIGIAIYNMLSFGFKRIGLRGLNERTGHFLSRYQTICYY